MATVTVVEGTPEELKELFPNTFKRSSVDASQVIQSEEPRKVDAHPQIWDFGEFTHYWRKIKPEARRFLTELANQPSGYHASGLKEKFGWSFNELAGKLTSLKFQLKDFPGKPMVYGRDQTIGYKNGHTYIMETYLADYIRRLTESG